MTFKEKLQKEHPEYVCSILPGGCMGCPMSYGYETQEAAGCKGEHRDVSDERCTACWNREIPKADGFRTNISIVDEWATYKSNMLTEYAKSVIRSIYGAPKVYIPDIKKVIFNDPATIVIWADGEKTVVKCQNGEPYDPEKGLAMAISKRALGNKHEYYNTFKHWLKKYNANGTTLTIDFGCIGVTAEAAVAIIEESTKKMISRGLA